MLALDGIVGPTTFNARRIELRTPALEIVVNSTLTIPRKLAGAVPTRVVLSSLRLSHVTDGSVVKSVTVSPGASM